MAASAGTVFRFSFGVPVTVTGSVKETETWIVSPALYDPLAFDELTLLTVGAVVS